MKKDKPKIEIPFADIDFLNAWGEWILYRKQRHLANYTPVGLPRTFKRIFDDSNGDVKTAIAIIEQSIEKNWQGLFPLKKDNNGKQVTGNKQEPIADDKYKDAINKFASGW